MRIAVSLLLVGLFSLTPSPNLNAQIEIREANWDRSVALSVARQTDVNTALKPLFQMADRGSNPELLNALSSIAQDPAMPGPEKDFLVFSFAIGLGDLDSNAVSPAVLDFLVAYESRTWVRHVDHPRMSVPLFNVRAAAAGVRNQWGRQQASIRASGLLQSNPDQWISSFLEAGLVERRGFLDALDFASIEQLSRFGWSALARLDEKPELTLATAKAGMVSGDFELLLHAIARGGGPGLSQALAAVSSELSGGEVDELLDRTLHSGSDTRAALAIAHLAPGRLDDPVIVEMLFGALADPNLGAAAALVLAASQDLKIKARLNEIAAGKEGLPQQRAELAIGTLHANQGVEQ